MEQKFHYPEKTRTFAALLKLVCKKNIFKEKYIDKTGEYDLVIPIKTMAKLFNMDYENLSAEQINSIIFKIHSSLSFDEEVKIDGGTHYIGYNIISSTTYDRENDCFGIIFSKDILEELFDDCI